MLTSNDLIYSVSKSFFGFGMGNSLLFSIYSGAAAILDVRWPNIDNIKYNLYQFKPTILFAVPSVFEQLIDIDFDCGLRIAQSSGSHLSAEIAKKWHKKFGMHLLNGIGATELLHLFATNKHEDNRLGSVGKIFDGYEFKIVDEDENQVGIGEIGGLLINSPTLAMGYSKDGVLTKFDQDWYKIGDLFSQDKDGYLYFHGRTDDRFKINGRWIIPLEVENKILSHYDALDQCYVTCIQNDGGYDTVILFVVNQKNKFMLQELDNINNFLPNYQKINRIILVDDLPINTNGKLDRKQFKKIATYYIHHPHSDRLKLSNFSLDKTQYEDYLSQGYNLIPVWKKISFLENVDSTTLFKTLKKDQSGYLFETYDNVDDQYLENFSIIGLDAHEKIEINDQNIRYIKDNILQFEKKSDHPLNDLKEIQNKFKVPKFKELPKFYGGFFGYFGFETTRLIEPRLTKKEKKVTDFPVPDVVQIISRDLVVVDHSKSEIYCIVHATNEESGNFEYAQQRCEFISNQVAEFILNKNQLSTLNNIVKHEEVLDGIHYASSKQYFLNNVDKVKAYIKSGDVMQVVLSQRMQIALESTPLNYYRSLKKIAHAPYTYYIDIADFQIVGASPEELLKLNDNIIVSRPMAGTRRRTGNLEHDKIIETELLNDEKEKCEHMMLVDLARNDLGRLALPGLVKVEELMKVKFYSHVMHIVSKVTAPVENHITGLDALVSTFPAGTLSGASKIRALEIIAELEPHPRGIYGGVIGYINWHGDADLAISIRTSLIKDQKIYIQAGAGIVDDSIAENEWQETIDKSSLLLIAAQNANDMTSNIVEAL